jgi:hypothetical protein
MRSRGRLPGRQPPSCASVHAESAAQNLSGLAVPASSGVRTNCGNPREAISKRPALINSPRLSGDGRESDNVLPLLRRVVAEYGLMCKAVSSHRWICGDLKGELGEDACGASRTRVLRANVLLRPATDCGAVFAGRSVSATSVSGLRQRWKEVSLRAQLTQKGTRRRLPERRDRRALRCHASFAVA